MSWVWLSASIVLAILSLCCIISTCSEVASGKNNLKRPEFWGAAVFHGVTAVLALWFLLKAFGKM